jgi:hypothetical protein
VIDTGGSLLTSTGFGAASAAAASALFFFAF